MAARGRRFQGALEVDLDLDLELVASMPQRSRSRHRGGKGDGGRSRGAAGSDEPPWAKQAFYRERGKNEDLVKENAALKKKTLQEEEDKSLRTKIHTGVTACLRMSGLSVPGPIQQPLAGSGGALGPPANPQQNMGAAGFSLNPFQMFGGGGAHPAGAQGVQHGQAGPQRATDYAWGLPRGNSAPPPQQDPSTELPAAALFAGLKKVDEFFGALNSGKIDIVRRDRSRSRRSSRGSGTGSRSSRSTKRSPRSTKRSKKSMRAKAPKKRSKSSSPSSPPSKSDSGSESAEDVERDKKDNKSGNRASSSTLPVKLAGKGLKKPGKSEKEDKTAATLEDLILHTSPAAFAQAAVIIKEGLDITADDCEEEPKVENVRTGSDQWAAWLSTKESDNALARLMKENGVKYRSANKEKKIQTLMKFTIEHL